MFQILMFDAIRRRTCLHYAAYYGNIDCLKAILSAAHSTPVADSWLDSLCLTYTDAHPYTLDLILLKLGIHFKKKKVISDND